MKIFKRIIAIIVATILLLILSFNIFNFISINILGNELPTINGYAYLEVISGSMEPKISIGDIVIIDTKVSDYKVKDIVTFKDINGSFVTHRIMEIKDDEIITQGDANNTIDDSITKDKIVGRYVYKIDGIGALMNSFKNPLTLILILIIGIILCVLISTDSKGNAILTKEEKEYVEFLESKKKKQKEIKKELEKTIEPKKTVKKEPTPKKETTKKEPPKKTVKKEPTPKKETTKKEPPKKTVKKETTPKKETTKKETPKKTVKKEPTPKKETTKKETPKKTIKKEPTPKKETTKKEPPKKKIKK